MIRGWKLDPRWREYYERRYTDKIAREIERIELAFQIKQRAIDLDEMRKVNKV